MMKLFGLGVFLLSCLGLFWTNRRAFNRRNMMGIEEFASYEAMLGWRFLEGTVRIVSVLGLVVGFMVFCVAYGLGR
jgi:hypothetical protein